MSIFENATMPIDFTLDQYTKLCQTILRAGYQTQTVEAHLKTPTSRPVVIVRHDVDRNVANAVQMAQLEKALGIQATYYVRAVSGVFDPGVIAELHNLGHEVGYHYEVLAKAGGDIERALDLFRRELARFREWVPVSTACMHGSPLSRWNNLTIWEQARLDDFGLFGEPYLNIDYSQVAYYTDTGRAWDSQNANLRDRVKGRRIGFPRVHSTNELIHLVQTTTLPAFCIQTHPERWNESTVGWLRSAVMDYGANSLKLLLSIQRLIE